MFVKPKTQVQPCLACALLAKVKQQRETWSFMNGLFSHHYLYCFVFCHQPWLMVIKILNIIGLRDSSRFHATRFLHQRQSRTQRTVSKVSNAEKTRTKEWMGERIHPVNRQQNYLKSRPKLLNCSIVSHTSCSAGSFSSTFIIIKNSLKPRAVSSYRSDDWNEEIMTGVSMYIKSRSNWDLGGVVNPVILRILDGSQ